MVEEYVGNIIEVNTIREGWVVRIFLNKHESIKHGNFLIASSGDSLQLFQVMQVFSVHGFFYVDALLVAEIKNGQLVGKTIPKHGSAVRKANKSDLSFLTKPVHSAYVGKIADLDMDFFLDADKIISSNTMIIGISPNDYCNMLSLLIKSIDTGALIIKTEPALDVKGLKCYSLDNSADLSLKINIKHLRPYHLSHIFNRDEIEVMEEYYYMYGEEWINYLVLSNIDVTTKIQEVAKIREKMAYRLGIYKKDDQLAFNNNVWTTTGDALPNIIQSVLNGEKVVISLLGENINVIKLICEILFTTLIRARQQKGGKEFTAIIVDDMPLIMHTCESLVDILRTAGATRVGVIGAALRYAQLESIVKYVSTFIIMKSYLDIDKIVVNCPHGFSIKEKIYWLRPNEAIVLSYYLPFAVCVKVAD